MKKRIVLEGELCDVCGRIAEPKNMYVGGHNDWSYVGPKSLEIRMSGTDIFYDITQYRKNRKGRPRSRKFDTVCPRCAAKLSNKFQAWLDECWRDGETDRMKRRLDLESRFERAGDEEDHQDKGQRL